jgi:type IV secretory pathway VirB10-like protein
LHLAHHDVQIEPQKDFMAKFFAKPFTQVQVCILKCATELQESQPQHAPTDREQPLKQQLDCSNNKQPLGIQTTKKMVDDDATTCLSSPPAPPNNQMSGAEDRAAPTQQVNTE